MLLPSCVIVVTLNLHALPRNHLSMTSGNPNLHHWSFLSDMKNIIYDGRIPHHKWQVVSHLWRLKTYHIPLRVITYHRNSAEQYKTVPKQYWTVLTQWINASQLAPAFRNRGTVVVPHYRYAGLTSRVLDLRDCRVPAFYSAERVYFCESALCSYININYWKNKYIHNFFSN